MTKVVFISMQCTHIVSGLVAPLCVDMGVYPYNRTMERRRKIKSAFHLNFFNISWPLEGEK